MTRLKTASALLGLGLVSLVGCSGGVGEVSGKVSYQGKPLTTGTVVMVGPDGRPASSPIGPDGTYRCVGVGSGKARLTVSSPPPAAASAKERAGRDGFDADKPSESREPTPASTAAPGQAANWVALPAKYADPNQTDLFFEVKAGPNTHDIELK